MIPKLKRVSTRPQVDSAILTGSKLLAISPSFFEFYENAEDVKKQKKL